ncbi:MAG: NUDIX domain-containing protein [Alphaproteobacteria bacterium]|nr:NUDIX domain-containing protein [Alphaproteobacteria bacterium]
MSRARPAPFVGVGVIIRQGDRVLLGRRLCDPGRGTWQFPGGKLEFGESVFACARREAREEAGVTIAPRAQGPTVLDVFTRQRLHAVTIFVIADHRRGTPRALEPEKAEDWRWVAWAALPRPLFAPIRSLLRLGFDLGQPGDLSTATAAT